MTLSQQAKGPLYNWRLGVCLVGTEMRTGPMDHILEKQPGQKVSV